ncbi:hypothetical protein M9458_012625, partial [Cirrhinus mrigala]
YRNPFRERDRSSCRNIEGRNKGHSTSYPAEGGLWKGSDILPEGPSGGRYCTVERLQQNAHRKE